MTTEKASITSVAPSSHLVRESAANMESAGTPGTATRRSASVVFAAIGVMLIAVNLRPAIVSVAPVIDDVTSDTGFSNAVAGLLTTLPVLFFGLVAPLAPRIAARIGIERTIFGAMVVLIAAIGIRLIPSTGTLFAGSVLIGAAIGICNVLLPALIKRDFAHHSGLMTGLYSMTLNGGAAVAAALTVPIDRAVDGNWRLTLCSWVILAVVAMAVWAPQTLRSVATSASSTTGDASTSLWRNPIAWAITIFMGSQSLIFYTFAAWLPTYLVDHGMTRSAAGNILALGQVAALVMSLVVPIIAGRVADQRLVTGVVIAICAAGFVGLLTGPWPAFWAICVMIGPGASIGLSLLFMVVRSSSTAQTGVVSGMAQAVGYVVAALGPLAIGAIHDGTGSWTVAMGVLSVALAPQAVAAWWAARDVRMTR